MEIIHINGGNAPIDTSSEPNIGPLSETPFAFAKGDLLQAGCNATGGNAIDCKLDTLGRVEEIICPSFRGPGKCAVGTKVCPNVIRTVGVLVDAE